MTGLRLFVVQHLFGAKSFCRLVASVQTIVPGAPSPLRKRAVQMRERHRLRQNAAHAGLHAAALVFRHQMRRHNQHIAGELAIANGLGKRKREYLPLQFTPEQIETMHAIKRRFDPHWLLGRGTLFEVPVTVHQHAS